ncbi:MAG: hypothetical protein J6S69_10255, partial [Proteobacteria bacterium]|nr:hypothetical protein [Pseudomonadota bacterium]
LLPRNCIQIPAKDKMIYLGARLWSYSPYAGLERRYVGHTPSIRAAFLFFSPDVYLPKAIHLFYDAKISYFSIFYEMIFIMTKRFSYIIEFEWFFQSGVL